MNWSDFQYKAKTLAGDLRFAVQSTSFYPKANELLEDAKRQPMLVVTGALMVAALLTGTVAYSTNAPEPDCPNNPEFQEVAAKVKDNNKAQIDSMYRMVDVNSSKYFDINGGNTCLTISRMANLDLSLGMPDPVGLNLALEALITALRETAYKKACDLASSTLNDVISKYNGIASTLNSWDSDGSVNSMVGGVIAGGGNGLQTELTNRAAQWSSQAKDTVNNIAPDTTALKDAQDKANQVYQSNYCASTSGVNTGLTNVAQIALAKANVERALYGLGCMASQSKTCSDGLYYQKEYACTLVPYGDNDAMRPRDQEACDSYTAQVTEQEKALNSIIASLTGTSNQVVTTSGTSKECQGAISDASKTTTK